MSNILTLAGPGLSPGLAERVRAAVGGAPLVWLGSHACDMVVNDVVPVIEDGARHALKGASVDLLAQSLAHRRKKLLIADMDSTIITCECLDELADFAGVKAEIVAITERAMRGELDFSAALRARVAKLQGLAESALEQCYAERVRLNPGASTLVRTMAAHGAATALISGGFTFFTERVARLAGFAEHRANVLDAADGALTGTVAEPILTGEAKLAALNELVAHHGLDMAEAMTVGDGANDAPMLAAAGLGIAYRGKPVAQAAARARLDHADLDALLHFQGYRTSDFVS
ncbi:phosphoserine phosphatase SerB [Zavarzinia sp. CC-PAN008]|uniref:phosphoserine phosphatase SerB n=1 Tax=Zavarzinia sp. CC-PAN008 TaxID=3243332 RepID=UPI003F745A1B